jgi:SAM-dependent methyltransferase
MTTVNQPGSVPPEWVIDADAFNAFEADGWERQAPTYDHFFGRLTSRLVDPLLDAADVAPGKRVLDVATGPGYAAAKATERGASVVGVDIAPAMIQLARQRHPDIEFGQADAEALPFEDGSFDAVISNFVVPHLGRPEHAVNEFVRVLNDGGRLSLTTWDLPERMRLLGVFLDAFTEAGATPPDDLPVGPPFFRYAVDEQFAALLGGNRLTGIEVRTIGFSHRVASADDLWSGMLTGTVRTSAFLLGQPEQTRREIRAAFDRQVLEYQRGDRLELPVSVKLAHGHKGGMTGGRHDNERTS